MFGIDWKTGDELAYHLDISKHNSNKPELSHSEPFKFIRRGTTEPHYGAKKRIDDELNDTDCFDRMKLNIKTLTN